MYTPNTTYSGEAMGKCATCDKALFHTATMITGLDGSYCSDECYRDAMMRLFIHGLAQSTFLRAVCVLGIAGLAAYFFLNM